MGRLTIFLAMLTAVSINSARALDGQIVVGAAATDIEHYAALELQRYLYQLSGSMLSIVDETAATEGPTFVVGTKQSNAIVKRLAAAGQLEVAAEELGPEGYVLKKLRRDRQPLLAIVGHDAIGTLYGVYGLLDDHYGVGFYLTGDVLPARTDKLEIPDVDECKTPTMRIRGVLPWTNFHQSATVFSWNDWKFVLDQAAKMRLNFIHIHNYNKGHKWDGRGHTEMFHTFQYQGFMKRSWMASASTGHHWCCPAWDVNEYRFGAADLFADYDFGADCTLHNESLTNEQVASKGISEFERVISYAHTRGIKIGLGLDIDVIPPEYGVPATNSQIVQSRIDQITSDYPHLDYLLCFQSEKHSAWSSEEYQQWRAIFDQFYAGVKAKSPHTRLAVSGWGLQAEPVASLPEDVICAPIARYGANFENGEIYGNREYWACPWLEVDGGCSQHYYPYGTHLSTTVAAYEKRAANMTGLFCLTWRIGDAIEPKLSYIAKAPWDLEQKYATSYDVYHEYAEKNYGAENAAAVTAIINENEPFAEDHGECRQTPHFTGSNRRAEQTPILELAYITLTRSNSTEQPSLAVPKIPAVNYAIRRGPTLQKFSSEDHGEYVRKIVSGDWLLYEDVDFGSGTTSITFEASARKALDAEVRLDGPNGPLLGVCDLAGPAARWKTFQTNIETTTGSHNLCLRFLLKEKNDLQKAITQLDVIDRLISKCEDIGQQSRLDRLKNRLAAVKNYLDMDERFPTLTWDELPGGFDDWVGNFITRVHDISSLGNIISIQNRFVKLRYVSKVEELRQQHTIKSPSYVTARGTADGAVIRWQNEQPEARGFYVYRDGQRINQALLSPDIKVFTDRANGVFAYRVTAVDQAGQESPRSVPSRCSAGDADTTSPRVIVISPPTSQPVGQPVDVVARILDECTFESISATLYYRRPAERNWHKLPMKRQAKAVFAARIAGPAVSAAGLEYFVAASDGLNEGYFPSAGRALPASLVGYSSADTTAPAPPLDFVKTGHSLRWQSSDDDVYWYQIYRSKASDFQPSPATLLTYLPQDTTQFTDNGRDRYGHPLEGTYFYCVTAVDETGNESSSTPVVKIAQTALPAQKAQSFVPTWKSLQQYECPTWFRDAKFGIYAHWGPYSVPSYEKGTDWYSHHMYEPGHAIREFHEATYGTLDEFGYKDFIPMFKAEEFDPDAWAKLFVEAGAKFAGPVAEHADGFSMWNSRLTPWNAVDMGPHRDVVGELEQAIRKQGLKFMTSMHHQWKWAWYSTWLPETDASDPSYSQLYGPPADPAAFEQATTRTCRDVIDPELLPPDSFADEWLAKVKEVVDHYHPDLLWFDNRMNILPKRHRLQMVAHFYNQASREGREVVLNYKDKELQPGTAVLDLERKRMTDIYADPWLCDMSIASNSWSYATALDYYSTARLIHDLVDIVSKNGCLLLNIAPHPDGTIPAEQQQRLRGMGAWLRVNGEAIYGTRPWKIYGEGPTKIPQGHLADLQFEGFSAKDIRFTTKNDSLYAIVLGWSGEGQTVRIESLAKNDESIEAIASIQLLGHEGQIQWKQTDEALLVTLPQRPEHSEAIVFKVAFAKVHAVSNSGS